MVQLQYKSLVTNEIIDYYLSKIKDDKEREASLSTVSKFDIRISTSPVIKGSEFYYKIWIWRRGTKKRAHIKQYYSLELINEERFQTIPLTLGDILDMIRVDADVPDDFEEYCEMHFENPSDPICRMDYLMDLRRAERFKKFLTIDEIRSFPSLDNDSSNDDNYINNSYNNNNKLETIDLNNKVNLDLLGFEIVWMSDKKEYDKLANLQNILEYYVKIVESYGYDPSTDNYDSKKFPITKEDSQRENIAKDFDNYDQALSEYNYYLKELIKKYNIKPRGNLVKRLAFNLNKNDTNLKLQNCKFIRAVVDLDDFS